MGVNTDKAIEIIKTAGKAIGEKSQWAYEWQCLYCPVNRRKIDAPIIKTV